MDKHFPSLRDYGDPTSDFLIEDTTEADEANPNQAWRPYVEYIDVDGGSPEANVLLPTSHHGGHDPYRLPSLPPDDQSMVVDSEELLPSRSPADNAQPDRLEELLLRSIGLPDMDTGLNIVQADGQGEDHNSNAGVADLSPALQTELVHLYFQTIHTFCPVVNEFDFFDWYESDVPAQKRSPLQELVLHSMLFAAFAYLDEAKLVSTHGPYDSVIEGQRALFKYARGLYNVANADPNNQGDLALIQAALILSHWSPYDESRDVNYFWVDEAVRHATAGQKFRSKLPHDRVVWWCCLTRNRLLALALRRPHKLKQYHPFDFPLIADFRRSQNKARVTLDGGLPRSKIHVAELFVALCKLSVIMNKIILQRHGAPRWDEWRRPRSGAAATGDNLDSSSSQSDVDELMLIDRELNEWHSTFQHVVSRFDERDVSRHLTVSVHVLRIMSHSTKVFLYEQYLRPLGGQVSLSWLLNNLAISKLKDASCEIAAQVGLLQRMAKPEDLPTTLAAWVLQPTCVLLAQRHFPPGGYVPEDSKLVCNLIALFRQLSGRFEGVQHVSRVVYSLNQTFRRIVREHESSMTGSLERDLLQHSTRVLNAGVALGVTIES